MLYALFSIDLKPYKDNYHKINAFLCSAQESNLREKEENAICTK